MKVCEHILSTSVIILFETMYFDLADALGRYVIEQKNKQNNHTKIVNSGHSVTASRLVEAVLSLFNRRYTYTLPASANSIEALASEVVFGKIFTYMLKPEYFKMNLIIVLSMDFFLLDGLSCITLLKVFISRQFFMQQIVEFRLN